MPTESKRRTLSHGRERRNTAGRLLPSLRYDTLIHQPDSGPVFSVMVARGGDTPGSYIIPTCHRGETLRSPTIWRKSRRLAPVRRADRLQVDFANGIRYDEVLREQRGPPSLLSLSRPRVWSAGTSDLRRRLRNTINRECVALVNRAGNFSVKCSTILLHDSAKRSIDKRLSRW